MYNDDKDLTIAIVIGISEYNDPSILNLKYADLDALSFESFLKENGVKDISVLINENATRQNILTEIGEIAAKKFNLVEGVKRLIVFFSGHGDRCEENSLVNSVLFTYNTDSRYKSIESITMNAMIGAISRCSPDEVFIFIDACMVQFDNCINIFSHSEETCFRTSKANYLFAYFAAANSKAYENDELKSGCFTESLIRNLRMVNSNTKSIDDLTTKISSEFDCTKEQKPHFVSYGNKRTWLFNNVNSTSENITTDKTLYVIHRKELLESLKSVICCSEIPVFVFGESGIGKTTLINEALKDEFSKIYISITKEDNGYILENIASEIAHQAINIFPDGRPKETANATLEYFSTHRTNEIIIIDHIDRNEKIAISVIDGLLKHNIKLVLIGREVLYSEHYFNIWQCPKLTLNELQVFCATNSINFISATNLLRKSDGLPIKVLDIISNHEKSNFKNEALDEIEYCINAISRNGGYINERVFKEVFNIKTSVIDELLNRGKIVYVADKYVLHDSMVSTNETSISMVYVCKYWTLQVLQTPNVMWASKRLVTTLISYSNTFENVPDLEEAILLALRNLEKSKDWILLKQLTCVLVDKKYPYIKTLINLAKIFAHRSNFKIVNTVESYLNSLKLSDEDNCLMQIVLAEKYWWNGLYSETKNVCDLVMNNTNDKKIILEASLHKGIACFFEGDWDGALDLFSLIDNIENIDDTVPQLSGWALYLSGTILGLLGIDIKKGKELFFSGIRVLQLTGDDSGLGIAWGNMAEMSWKLREYDNALTQAKLGYDMAVKTDNIINQIENSRNMLHILIRTEDKEDNTAIDDIMNRIDKLMTENMGDTVEMQIWNTYATVYAYRGDINELENMIKKAYNHTKLNKEYHIYTLSNICLYFCLVNNYEEAVKYYNRAYFSAISGKNFLAIRQLHDDIERINSKYMNNSTRLITTTISHNIIDIEKKIKGV